MNEREKPDLSTIEPIGKPPDAEDGGMQPAVGGTATGTPGAPPTPALDDDVSLSGSEPRTSPETEQELEKLRRG